MKFLFLHVGAGKCGSSFLQSYLSHYPTHLKQPETEGSDYSARSLIYCALRKAGITGPKKIKEEVAKSPTGYISSLMPRQLGKNTMLWHAQARSFLEEKKSDVLLSSEAWIESFHSESFRELLDKIIDYYRPDRVRVICVVRPPVEWLNSAWWQWGAWDRGLSLDRWIDKSLPMVKWSRRIRDIKRYYPDFDIKVLPLGPNLLIRFMHLLNIPPSESMQDWKIANSSLPAAILALYTRYPHLRSNPHDSWIDFSGLMAVSDSSYSFSGAPWVLSSTVIRRVITETNTDLRELIEYMNVPDRTSVYNNGRWWNSQAYADKCLADIDQIDKKEIQELAAALLESYHRLRMKHLSGSSR